jgi:hypothetical protein
MKQQNNEIDLKQGKRLEQTFLQRRFTNGQ